MKKALFITYNNIRDIYSGGSQCSLRNYQMLSNSYDTDVYTAENLKIQKLLSVFLLYFPPITRKDKKNILSLISIKEYELIFVDSSLFGKIIKAINKGKKRNIVSFFHNVEYDYISVRFGRKIIKYPYLLLAHLNEKWALDHSSIKITVNHRDEKRIAEIYGQKVDSIIPITFDKGKTIPTTKYDGIKHTDYFLFIGSLNNSNLTAIEWFIDNVVPEVKKIKLLIVGKDFETKRNKLEKTNIHVIGTTDNLEYFYENALAVISPIRMGGGMKVKIAEALMYGKTIFGTTEAFEGYDTSNENSTIVCNTAAEYIEKINHFLERNNTKIIFNTESRRLFEDKYSFENAVSAFEEVIKVKDLK
ncbi:MAG: glycosyltransferase [Paludibacteraceae bacterium]